MNKHSFIIIILFVILIHVRCDVISSSSLERCTVSSNGTNGQTVDCDRRFVVLLSLSGTETSPQIQAKLESATSRDQGEVKLDTPIVVECRVGRTIVTYPLFYKNLVNGNPYEEIITYSSLLNRCTDSREGSASCGWALDGEGNRVEDSQGFCCLCEFSDLFRPEDDKYRGDLGCNLFNWASSAHCMRLTSLWYGVYEIGEPRVTSDISCTITTELRTEELIISTTSPSAVSGSGRVAVKLEGEFNSFALKRSLLNRYLLVPSTPVDHKRVKEGKYAWMAVPMTDVGEECDKIGVSFESFRYQANGCGRAPGSCLRKSPEKLRKEDDELASAGESQQYMLTSFGDVIDPEKNDDHLYVSFYPAQTGVSTSLLSVSIVADDLSFVATESAAKILDGYVDEFKAMATSGVLHITVQNFGGLRSSYILQIPTCSNVVNPITPQTVTMGKEEVLHAKFDLSVTTVMSSDLYCDAQVISAQTGKIYDVFRIWFKPRQLTIEPPSDEGGNDASATYSVGTPGQCNKSCGLNIFCLFSLTECIIYPVLLILLIGGVVIGVPVCMKKVSCCRPCCKAVCCFPCMLCKHSKYKKKRRNRKNYAKPTKNEKTRRTPLKEDKIISIQTKDMDCDDELRSWDSFLNITISSSNKQYMIDNGIMEKDDVTIDKIAVKGILVMKGLQYYFTPQPNMMNKKYLNNEEETDLGKVFKCRLSAEQVRERISKRQLPGYTLIN